MITRVRIEASAPTPDALKDDLTSGIAFVQESLGGEWESEEGPVQTTRSGFWNFVLLKSKDYDFQGNKRIARRE